MNPKLNPQLTKPFKENPADNSAVFAGLKWGGALSAAAIGLGLAFVMADDKEDAAHTQQTEPQMPIVFEDTSVLLP